MGRSIADLAQRNRHIPEAKCSDMDVGLSGESGASVAVGAKWKKYARGPGPLARREFFETHGGSHDPRIAPLGRHPSDRPALRDGRRSEHTFPSDWRSGL